MLKSLKLMTVAGITTASFVAFAGPGSVGTNPTNPGTQPSVTDHSLTPPPTGTVDGSSIRMPFDDTREEGSEVMGIGNSKRGVSTTSKKGLSGFGLTTEQIREAQSQLSLNGHSIAVDGVMGPETAKAIRDFQANQGLEQSGVLDGSTLKALDLDNDRAPASVNDYDRVMDDSERVK